MVTASSPYAILVYKRLQRDALLSESGDPAHHPGDQALPVSLKSGLASLVSGPHSAGGAVGTHFFRGQYSVMHSIDPPPLGPITRLLQHQQVGNAL